MIAAIRFGLMFFPLFIVTVIVPFIVTEIMYDKERDERWRTPKTVEEMEYIREYNSNLIAELNDYYGKIYVPEIVWWVFFATLALVVLADRYFRLRNIDLVAIFLAIAIPLKMGSLPFLLVVAYLVYVFLRNERNSPWRRH